MKASGNKDLILAIDHGTQSVRALLFDPQGMLLAKSQVPIEPYLPGEPGIAEQKPEAFWEALCQACQGLWAQFEAGDMSGMSKERIAGVALTTQRSTLINLDKRRGSFTPGDRMVGRAQYGGAKTCLAVIGGWLSSSPG